MREVTKPDAFEERMATEADVYAKRGYVLVDPARFYAFLEGARWARQWTLANDETVRALVEALEHYQSAHYCACGFMCYGDKTAQETLAAWKEKGK